MRITWKSALSLSHRNTIYWYTNCEAYKSVLVSSSLTCLLSKPPGAFLASEHNIGFNEPADSFKAIIVNSVLKKGFRRINDSKEHDFDILEVNVRGECWKVGVKITIERHYLVIRFTWRISAKTVVFDNWRPNGSFPFSIAVDELVLMRRTDRECFLTMDDDTGENLGWPVINK